MPRNLFLLFFFLLVRKEGEGFIRNFLLICCFPLFLFFTAFDAVDGAYEDIANAGAKLKAAAKATADAEKARSNFRKDLIKM